MNCVLSVFAALHYNFPHPTTQNIVKSCADGNHFRSVTTTCIGANPCISIVTDSDQSPIPTTQPTLAPGLGGRLVRGRVLPPPPQRTRLPQKCRLERPKSGSVTRSVTTIHKVVNPCTQNSNTFRLVAASYTCCACIHHRDKSECFCGPGPFS